MKTYSKLVRAGLWLGTLQLALVLCQTLPAQTNVALSITPLAVSNTYGGTIKVQVTGLNTGATVVVQEFLDANSNGVVDAGDALVQQFRLTDGQATVIGGVTNVNVPGDSNPTNGAITAQLNFQNGDLVIVGQYLVVLSSPTGTFAPITNRFNVTNTPYAQSISGAVYGLGTNIVPNAVVLLFQPTPGGNQNPQGGVVANNSGSYTIQVPPGSYQPAAFKSNFVANLGAGPYLTIGAGSNLANINLSLLQATQSISGKFVDTNSPSTGLPGILVPIQSTNGLLAIGYTDTNGNFNVPVVANAKWKVSDDTQALPFQGYLGLQNSLKVDTSSGSQSNVVIALTKATALFYGTVKDNLGNPLAGVRLSAQDNNFQYDSSATTDQNGYYVAGAVAATWNGSVSSDSNAKFANYVFSQALVITNYIANGQALEADFVGILATNHITGYVKDTNGVPFANVQIYANATIPDFSGTNYSSFNAYTDTNGFYSLNVANGTWYVNVNCCNNCGNGSWPPGYQCPGSQSTNIFNTNGVVNFVAYPCGPLEIITNDLPGGTVNVYYDNFLGANGCNQPFSWLQTGGALPPGLNLNANGEIFGNPTAQGNFCFTVQVTDNNNNRTNATLCIDISAGLQITTTNLPTATQGQFYSTNLSASGGNPPYIWNLAPSNNLPAGLNLSTNGQISGVPGSPGTTCFNVQVSDNNNNTVFANFCLTVNPSGSTLQITTTNLPNAIQGQFYSASLSASGGSLPYSWNLCPSNYLPAGLNLTNYGQISGTPASPGTTCFCVQVMDSNHVVAVTNLCLTVNPSGLRLQITTLSLPNASQGAFYTFTLGASGGLPPYNWSLSPGSAPLPSSLSLASNGVLSGYPTASGNFSFWVRVTDSRPASVDQLLSLTVFASTNNPHLLLTAPRWNGQGQFQFTLDTASGVKYTLQVSSDLKTWTSLGSFTGTGGPLTIIDDNAFANPRLYRIKIGS